MGNVLCYRTIWKSKTKKIGLAKTSIWSPEVKWAWNTVKNRISIIKLRDATLAYACVIS